MAPATATESSTSEAAKAKKGIAFAGLFLILVMLFGSGRTLTAKQYLSATAGATVETELVNVAKHRSPSVDVVTQLQYTQQALYKAELLTDDGTVIKEASQDVSSSRDRATKRLDIDNWPNPTSIKVRLTVASQSITATPPQGVTADQVPVIFEVKVYRQWFNRQYLWPALWACLGLWTIAHLAAKKEEKDKPKEWV